jgi:hypothetical protein
VGSSIVILVWRSRAFSYELRYRLGRRSVRGITAKIDQLGVLREVRREAFADGEL